MVSTAVAVRHTVHSGLHGPRSRYVHPAQSVRMSVPADADNELIGSERDGCDLPMLSEHL